MESYLIHHGILGQKWGIRRYQNPDGSLTAAGQRRREKQIERMDSKWLKKNGDRVNRAVSRAVKPYIDKYEREVIKPNIKMRRTNGKLNQNYVHAYNKRLAELMNMAVGDLEAPSGHVVRFVAKRGSIGVETGLATKGIDMRQFRNGVYEDGRVAYRKDVVGRV